MTAEELAGALAFLASVYPGQEWNEAQATIWVDYLDWYDPAICSEALREMARQDRFPTIAGFCEYAEAILETHRPKLPGRNSWMSGELPPAPDELATPTERGTAIATARRLLRGEQ